VPGYFVKTSKFEKQARKFEKQAQNRSFNRKNKSILRLIGKFKEHKTSR